MQYVFAILRIGYLSDMVWHSSGSLLNIDPTCRLRENLVSFVNSLKHWTSKGTCFVHMPYHIIFLHIACVDSQTRAPRGTDRSPEYKEHFSYKLDSRVKNVTTEWNQKQQHFITHALDHCYEFGLLL